MRRPTGFRWGVIYPLAAGQIDWLLRIMMLALLAPPVTAAADVRGVADEPCPPGANRGGARCLDPGRGRPRRSRQCPPVQWFRSPKVVLGCRDTCCCIAGCGGVRQYADSCRRRVRDRFGRPKPPNEKWWKVQDARQHCS